MSDIKERVGTVKVCPACGQSIGSFQTKCPSCGHELSSAAAEESVQSFFQKLDELAEREYQANKKQEGKAKQKKKSPWPLRICEVFAVMSLILIILYVTGINEFLTGPRVDSAEIPSITIVNNTGYEIVEIYISPSEHDHYGHNWLNANEVLSHNGSAEFTMLEPLGSYRTYDILLRDIEGDVYLRQVNISQEKDRQIRFTMSNLFRDE